MQLLQSSSSFPSLSLISLLLPPRVQRQSSHTAFLAAGIFAARFPPFLPRWIESLAAAAAAAAAATRVPSHPFTRFRRPPTPSSLLPISLFSFSHPLVLLPCSRDALLALSCSDADASSPDLLSRSCLCLSACTRSLRLASSAAPVCIACARFLSLCLSA